MKRYSNLWVFCVAVAALLVASNAAAQKRLFKDYQESLQKKMDAVMEELGEGKCEVIMHESSDGDGQDVEMQFTMPLERYIELAPRAALEAASLQQRFKMILIWLRHKRTNRVGRVWFRSAEPIARKYVAQPKDPDVLAKALEDMKEHVTWQ